MARSDKQQERMEQIAHLLANHSNGMSQSEVAQKLNLDHSEVQRLLPAMQDVGLLLTEDERGRLGWFGRSNKR